MSRFQILFTVAATLACLWSNATWTHRASGQDAAISESDQASLLQPYQQAAVERWETAISKLEELDAQHHDPDDAILFVGSSSVRLWRSIATDMAPYRTIQRGYGGARFSDVAVFAKRLLHPHRYRGLVMFVGNDVVGSPNDHTPDQVEALVRYIVSVSHAHQGDAPVFLIEVTPTERRFAVWPEIRAVNARLREIALSTPNTHFIATAEHYLDPDGNPRSELFVGDKLHLNESGYRVWARIIRRHLDDQLRIRTLVQARQAEPNKGNSEAAQ